MLGILAIYVPEGIYKYSDSFCRSAKVPKHLINMDGGASLKKYCKLFLWLGVLSLIFANTAKGVIYYAPVIGWLSALMFSSIAAVIIFFSKP